MSHLSLYGPSEGPLGFPMPDDQAKALDAVLTDHPHAEYARLTIKAAVEDTRPDERTDISWITTEAVDHHREVVLASGMDDSHYRTNPIVTLDHNYWQPPVGKSLWRRRIRSDSPKGVRRGIQAKTHYPPRPDDLAVDTPWSPDHAFALVRSGLMQGKSIGFVVLEAREPTPDEVRLNGWDAVRRIVTKWLLVEYAATWLPANPEAIVEAVSQNRIAPDDMHSLNLAVPQLLRRRIPFTTLDEVHRMIRTQLDTALTDQAPQAVRNSFTRHVGKF